MKNRPPHLKTLLSSESGFSLVELIIVMGIFIVAIMLSSDAFNRIASVSTQQIKASESNIQGIIGLEIMRADIEHAGYGLPWIVPFVADFEESQVAADWLAKGIDPASFNDTTNTSEDDANKVPRAVQAATAVSDPVDPITDGRDYLVLKSTALGMGVASRKWTFVDGIASGVYSLKAWGENDFVANDRVVVLDSRTRRLVTVSGAAALDSDKLDEGYTFSDALNATPNLSKTAFVPEQESDTYLVYGVAPPASDLTKNWLRVPYNRVDYYVKRPTTAGSMPQRCAPGTGILYKAVLMHTTTGGVTPYPLFECVADLQVVFAVDSDGSGPEVASLLNEGALEDLSAKTIREQLKQIHIYVLAHEGQKDRTYQYPNQKIYVGDAGSAAGREFDLAVDGGIGADWRNYRWKVYHFSVTPFNLNY